MILNSCNGFHKVKKHNFKNKKSITILLKMWGFEVSIFWCSESLQCNQRSQNMEHIREFCVRNPEERQKCQTLWDHLRRASYKRKKKLTGGFFMMGLTHSAGSWESKQRVKCWINRHTDRPMLPCKVSHCYSGWKRYYKSFSSQAEVSGKRFFPDLFLFSSFTLEGGRRLRIPLGGSSGGMRSAGFSPNCQVKDEGSGKHTHTQKHTH